MAFTAWAVSAGLSALQPAPVVAERTLAHLPLELAGFHGENHAYDDETYRVLRADDNLLRLYRGAGDGYVWLYVGYYGTRKGGRTGHLPQHCYPGAGYRIVDLGQETIQPRGWDREVRVNRILVERPSERLVALYWTQSRDRVWESGLAINVNRFARRLTGRRDDGAFVRLSAEAADDPAAALERQKRFAEELIPALASEWPVEA